MDTTNAQELISKFHEGTLSPEEEAILDGWYLSLSEEELASMTDQELQRRKAMILRRLNEGHGTRKTVKLWPRIAVAAAAVAAMVLCVYFFTAPRHIDDNRDLLVKNDIAPGRNGATITLGNGKVIALSDAKAGVVIGERVSYSDGSAVRYSAGVNSLTPAELQGADSRGQMLTASTARGQTYQFTLPDGTKVWLNAASSISFPSHFNGKERKIVLEGEGYFEVAKDKAHPFIANTGDQNVEVLGTHFNLNTFGDEHQGTVTSLLEGSVRITGREGTRVLKPGERGVNTEKGVLLLSGDANEDIDWKNGDFVFEQEPLAEIMKKVSRWYDVEVIYAADVDQQQTFGGKVSRKRNISQVIKALQATQALKFKIEGKKVYVSN